MARYANIGGAVPGCVTKDQTLRIGFTDSAQAVHLNSNNVYRIVADQDCFINFSPSGAIEGEINDASGVFLPANTIEILSTTKDRVFLQVEQATASGTLFASRILSRGV